MSSPNRHDNFENPESLKIFHLKNESDLSALLQVQWNNSFHSKIRALNEEFPSLGLPQFIKKYDKNCPHIDINGLVSASSSLFQHHLRSLNLKISKDEENGLIKAALEHSRTMHERCKEELKTVQNSLKKSQERERRTETEKISFLDQIRNLKETLRRQQSDFQIRNTQFQHEIQKLQKENDKLKVRFKSVLQQKSKLPSSIPPKSSSDINKSQLDLTRCQVGLLRERENELYQENRELRDLISVLSTRILRFTNHLHDRRCGVLHRSDGDQGEDQNLELEETSLDELSDIENESSDEEDLALDPVQRRKSANVNRLLLEMPFVMVRERLTSRVHRLSKRLWMEIKALNSQPPKADPQIVRKLERPVEQRLKIAEYEEEFESLSTSDKINSAQTEWKTIPNEPPSCEFRRLAEDLSENFSNVITQFTPTPRRATKR